MRGKKLERKQLDKLMSCGSKKSINVSYAKVLFLGRKFFRKSKTCTIQPHEDLIGILVYSSMFCWCFYFKMLQQWSYNFALEYYWI